MPGVAHTTGSRTHKEIHFSLDYIANLATKPKHTPPTPAPSKLPDNNAPIPPNRARDEIRGVLTHEVVHCYQYDADGTCPGGLIEGIAGTYIHQTYPALTPPLFTRLRPPPRRPRASPLETHRRRPLGRRLRTDGLFPGLARDSLWCRDDH